MTHVVYRFASERDQRLVKNVHTYREVKDRIADDCKLRSGRTHLVLKFDEDENVEVSPPKDDNEVEKNRRLIVWRLPILVDDDDKIKNEFRSASTASVKTTGRPVQSLRLGNQDLENCRRQQPRDVVVKWKAIWSKLSKCPRVRRLSSQEDSWPRVDLKAKSTVLKRLRGIRKNLKHRPCLALADFTCFRNTYKGTVYSARYCGRRSEYLLALERLYYGMFESDFQDV